MLGYQGPGMFYQLIDPAIVVVGVVMEEVQVFDAGLQCERHSIIHAAVSPADMSPVFRPVILRIQNQRIGAPHKLNQIPVQAARPRLGIG